MNMALDSIGADVGEALRVAGQRKVPMVTCTIEGALDETDIAAYCEQVGDLATTVKSDEKDVAVLRARHHQVARLLATGLPEGIVADLTGYEHTYLSNLKLTPSMAELISHYRQPGNQAVELLAEKLRVVADMSIERLIENIEKNDLDNNQLLAAAKLGADRVGNGPLAKVEHAHIHMLDGDQVERLARSAREESRPRIIDVTAVRQTLLPAPEKDEDAGN
jgi:hypothetical protein